MILPDAVDAEIFAGIALAQEPGLLQKPDRSAIAWNAGSFEAMQPQTGKGKRDHRPDRRRHVALPHEGQAGPVAETAGLGHTAANIGQSQAADQDAIGTAGDEKRITLVAS